MDKVTHIKTPHHKKTTKKRITKMQDETTETPPMEETKPVEEVPPVEPPAETPPAPDHDVVAQGGECSKCGWKWGDINPHPVHITPQFLAAVVEATPEPPPVPDKRIPN